MGEPVAVTWTAATPTYWTLFSTFHLTMALSEHHLPPLLTLYTSEHFRPVNVFAPTRFHDVGTTESFDGFASLAQRSRAWDRSRSKPFGSYTCRYEYVRHTSYCRKHTDSTLKTCMRYIMQIIRLEPRRVCEKSQIMHA